MFVCTVDACLHGAALFVCLFFCLFGIVFFIHVGSISICVVTCVRNQYPRCLFVQQMPIFTELLCLFVCLFGIFFFFIHVGNISICVISCVRMAGRCPSAQGWFNQGALVCPSVRLAW